jgi:hypothetical protein
VLLATRWWKKVSSKRSRQRRSWRQKQRWRWLWW